MFVHIVGALDSETKRKMKASGIVSALLAVTLVTTLGFFGGAFWNPTSPNEPNHWSAESLFTINHTVASDFADYIPYDEEYELNAPQYTVASDLSNIVNINRFGTLPTSVRDMIAENGFAVYPQSQYNQIHEILDMNDELSIPSFVSSDAVLHAYHVLYDLALREVEVYSFWDLLGNLTISLQDSSYQQYLNAPAGRWKDAALRNVIYFTVALSLIDNETIIPAEFPSEVAPAVSTVLQLIENHDLITNQWFMHYDEDFTQFVPRGHYTRSERLERYFLAMMWYGRVSFRLQPLPPEYPNEIGKNNTAQAILISLALADEVTGLDGNPSGFTVWDAIYEPTAFFVGTADDLVPNEYSKLILDVYGSDVELADLDSAPLLEQFISQALELREPLILGHPLLDVDDIKQTMGLRLMGQRFIPDSYILSQLVYKNVGTLDNPRLMPIGLDVMAAFGSDRAWELLDSEKAYQNYESQMKMLWNQIGNMTEEEWVHNLYYLWIYSLLPLLSDPGEGYPLFMQSAAWVDKQLSTALASWTELRHDTILYAKQSYTYTLSGMPQDVYGYVEPVPGLYARLAGLCKMMMTGLESRDLLSSMIYSKLYTLQNFLISLRDIAIKELESTALSSEDYSIIRSSGSVLGNIVEMPTDNYLVSDTDDDMAVVADVHTDPNTLQVLEEGIGRPMIILVAVPIDGQVYLTIGAVMSYYEFTWPMNDRLTDEAWQDMLDQGSEPSLPSWTGSFVTGWDNLLSAQIAVSQLKTERSKVRS